jgi:predicted nucleic acid-binding protein
MIRTYIDTNILIAAFKASEPTSDRSMEILTDINRYFVSSPFVRLELMPHVVFFQKFEEAAFYEQHFKMVREWVKVDPSLIHEAEKLACTEGLGGFDALHVVCARRGNVDELITAEKVTSPFSLCRLVNVVSIAPGQTRTSR